MKVAIFWDGSLGSISYYVKNGTAYSFKDDKPYMYNHTVSPQCFCNTQNWNFLWDTGYFLNLSEWFNNDKKLPDLDLDVIFYANDRHGLRDQYYDEYTVERIREYYPKAKIVGYLKEVYVSTDVVNSFQEKKRNYDMGLINSDDGKPCEPEVLSGDDNK